MQKKAINKVDRSFFSESYYLDALLEVGGRGDFLLLLLGTEAATEDAITLELIQLDGDLPQRVGQLTLQDIEQANLERK